jgi:hypothetical protein
MRHSLRTLLADIVDYAGLFPPARLPLEQVVGNYARYHQSPEAWMLSRMVCPVERLAELAPFCQNLFSSAAPCRLAVIGREEPLAPEIVKDLAEAHHFMRAQGQLAPIEALEVRLPAAAARDWTPEAIAEALNVLATRLLEHSFSDIEVYLEPIFEDDGRTPLELLVAALKLHDQERGEPAPGRVGLKLRTGGTEPAAFPPAERVAAVLVACRDANLPLKFTGGLHQPLAHVDAATQASAHGFLNVFVAGVLAQARGIGRAHVLEVLAERDPAAFTFTDEGCRWRDLEASIDDIDTARREFVLSFGSCSFDEPIAELRRLGLL